MNLFESLTALAVVSIVLSSALCEYYRRIGLKNLEEISDMREEWDAFCEENELCP